VAFVEQVVAEHNRVSYQIDFVFEGRSIGTIYWTGSLVETQELARKIANHLAADDFRVVELNDDAPVGRDSTLN
jgi:hypothetical protein